MQFGNRSQETVENVTIVCRFPNADNLGTITRAWLGPFKSYYIEPPYRGFDYEVVWGADSAFFVVEGVDLPAGQNYNVNYTIRINAPRGTQSQIQCHLFQGEGRLDQTAPEIDNHIIPVIVR